MMQAQMQAEAKQPEDTLSALLLLQREAEKKIRACVSTLLIVGSSIVSSTSPRPVVNHRRADLVITSIRIILMVIAELHEDIEEQYSLCALPGWASPASDYSELWEEFQSLLSDAVLFIEAYQVLLFRRVREVHAREALMRERYAQRCTIKAQLEASGEAISDVCLNCSQWRRNVRIAAQVQEEE
jgi:hypothetical protein